LYCLKSKL